MLGKTQEVVSKEAIQTDGDMNHRLECINGMLKMKEKKKTLRS